MKEVTRATPLCEFLRQCNASSLEKTVLDCGAGGERPPLSLFHQHGYVCHGVEIDPNPLGQARAFSEENGMEISPYNASRANNAARPTVARATALSAASITRRRFQRSTSAPMNGSSVIALTPSGKGYHCEHPTSITFIEGRHRIARFAGKSGESASARQSQHARG